MTWSGCERNIAAGRKELRSNGVHSNDLWCVDFEGEFKLGDEQYCYPLTATEHASRFVLLCEALESVREEPAFTDLENLLIKRVG